MVLFQARRWQNFKTMRHTKKIIALLLIVVITICVSRIGSLWWEFEKFEKLEETTTLDPWQEKHWKHVKVISDPMNLKINSKTILLWTKFFGVVNFVPQFSKLGCPQPHCSITTDRDLLNKSHAVIFHLRDISLADMPQFRTYDQVWILLHHESPHHTPGDILKQLDGVFNWTATYRYDSDILLSPVTKKRPKPTMIQQKTVGDKTLLVAWLVSNCRTPSNREAYVSEMQKIVQVDIYGNCGPFSCLPKMSDDCYKKLDQMYKFYLSFENSICKDYVSEKFFHILSTNMVPVVMGGANYSQIAPPNSFIDALSFNSPSDLALYLLDVAKDEKLYNSFFAWKETHMMVYDHYICQICRKLHDLKTNHSTYLNISDWWFQDANCRSWSS